MPRAKPFHYTLNPEEIPTKKNWDITREAYEGGPCVNYACPDSCWTEHLEAWSEEYKSGNKTAPQPQTYGHYMFSNPVAYGMVTYGCTDQAKIRKAFDNHVRGLLDGWDRDLTKEQLDKIVNATVDRKLAGVDVGAGPFMACVYANL